MKNCKLCNQDEMIMLVGLGDILTPFCISCYVSNFGDESDIELLLVLKKVGGEGKVRIDDG